MSSRKKDLGSLHEQYTHIVDKLFEKQFQLKPLTNTNSSMTINFDDFKHQLEQISKDLHNIQV